MREISASSLEHRFDAEAGDERDGGARKGDRAQHAFSLGPRRGDEQADAGADDGAQRQLLERQMEVARAEQARPDLAGQRADDRRPRPEQPVEEGKDGGSHDVGEGRGARGGVLGLTLRPPGPGVEPVPDALDVGRGRLARLARLHLPGASIDAAAIGYERHHLPRRIDGGGGCDGGDRLVLASAGGPGGGAVFRGFRIAHPLLSVGEVRFRGPQLRQGRVAVGRRT
ncbi:MAG TPA: hypothetical protein VGD66_13525 [Allosphingosinicella sp.]|jgi:hypothetical protein